MAKMEIISENKNDIPSNNLKLNIIILNNNENKIN